MAYRALSRPASTDRPAPHTRERQAPAPQPADAPVQRQVAPQHPAAASVPIGNTARQPLPTPLRQGVESLSGLDMSDVRVHHRSPRPTAIGAHAFAQGGDIHLAPGQERHLPHEAWHVVQQKQGRVQATGEAGDGLTLNDSPALEAEAEAMGARAGATARADPDQRPAIRPAPASSDTPIQGYFTFVSNRFVYNEASLRLKIAEIKDFKSFFSKAENVDAVLAKLKAWAESDVNEGFKGKTYPAVIKAAIKAVNEDRLKLAPTEPIELPTLSETPFDPKDILSKPVDEKIERLKKIHRSASLNATELEDFRDRSQPQWLTHRDHPSVQYGIARTTNFMLGGTLPDDYRELIQLISIDLGISGAALANVLLAALNGEEFTIADRPYAELPKEAITKFVALILGPETRRSAINALAVRAALEHVVRKGGDIFDVLREHALLFAAEPKDQRNKGLGGSKRSQFHREHVEENEEFKRIAKNQHDRISEYASRRGVDPHNEEQMDRFLKALMQHHADVHKKLFGSKSEEKATGPLPFAASMLEEGEINDNGKRTRPPTTDGYDLPEQEKREQPNSDDSSIVVEPTTPLWYDEDQIFPSSGTIVHETAPFLSVQHNDYAVYDGQRYYPNTPGIADGGECFWQTMQRYGYPEDILQQAAQGAGLIYNHHVDEQDMATFVTQLNGLIEVPITIRIIHFDFVTLTAGEPINFGNGGKVIRIGLFHMGEMGHYVPPS